MVGVTTALSTKLSLTASAGFEPSADKLDTVTKVSLLVKFL